MYLIETILQFESKVFSVKSRAVDLQILEPKVSENINLYFTLYLYKQRSMKQYCWNF